MLFYITSWCIYFLKQLIHTINNKRSQSVCHESESAEVEGKTWTESESGVEFKKMLCRSLKKQKVWLKLSEVRVGKKIRNSAFL